MKFINLKKRHDAHPTAHTYYPRYLPQSVKGSRYSSARQARELGFSFFLTLDAVTDMNVQAQKSNGHHCQRFIASHHVMDEIRA